MKVARNSFHLWFPNIFGFKGGIQVYSAFLLEALQNIAPNLDYDVFLKHDTGTVEEIQFLPRTRFHFSGRWTDRLRTVIFACQLFIYGLWQRPKLVISTHINFTLAAYWLKKIAGIPYWTVAHGVDAWEISNPALQTALKSADRILAVSNYTRDRLIREQNLDPNQISLLPNTFDANKFEIDNKPNYLLEKYHITPQQPVILTVARLDKDESYKGYDRVLQAIPAIRDRIPDICYIIVGKGNDLPRLQQLIAELELSDCVRLAGYVPDSELSDHYNLCDLFAMPSKGEGFGIVYLEALACGKPVLAGNCDGSLDALNHGELGILVDPNHIEQIAQSAIDVLQHNNCNHSIHQPQWLRQKVIDYFGFAHFQKTLEKHLKNYFDADDSKIKFL